MILASPNVTIETVHELKELILTADGEKQAFSDWWVLPSVLSFDNITVAKANAENICYLSCADCIGQIVGYQSPNDKKCCYVAHELVKETS